MTFQRLMDSVLGGLPFAFVYLDNILIASPDPGPHRRHLEAVFTVLQSNGLIIIADKCLFGCPEVDFLGHCLTVGGKPSAVSVDNIMPHLGSFPLSAAPPPRQE